MNVSNLTTTLYPMDAQSRNQVTNDAILASNVGPRCDSSPAIETRTGIIDQVTPGSIIVRDSFNQKFTLSISSCTKIAATKPDNFFATGNKVYFSGVQVFNILGNSLFDAYSVLIIPNWYFVDLFICCYNLIFLNDKINLFCELCCRFSNTTIYNWKMSSWVWYFTVFEIATK